MRKLIVISAPSGAGKTSIVHYLLKNMPELAFSVSACSREKRENETDGEDYYFLGVEGFKNKISENAFLEWEQVYENQYYGTLTSEIERIWSEGKNIIFDVDVEVFNFVLQNCCWLLVLSFVVNVVDCDRL